MTHNCSCTNPTGFIFHSLNQDDRTQLWIHFICNGYVEKPLLSPASNIVSNLYGEVADYSNTMQIVRSQIQTKEYRAVLRNPILRAVR